MTRLSEEACLVAPAGTVVSIAVGVWAIGTVIVMVKAFLDWLEVSTASQPPTESEEYYPPAYQRARVAYRDAQRKVAGLAGLMFIMAWAWPVWVLFVSARIAVSAVRFLHEAWKEPTP